MRWVWLVCLLLIVPAANASWSSFHGNSQNTGHVPDSLYAPFEDVWWNIKLDGEEAAQIEASPVTKDGIVVVGDWNGLVRGLDAESGAEIWRVQMAGKVTGTPAFDGNRVFVVDEAGTMKALDLHTGAELGTAAVGPTKASPTVHDGKIYIGNEAGEMKAYDTRSLFNDWTMKVTSVYQTRTVNPDTGASTCKDPHPVAPIRGAPAVYQGNVIFGALNDYVYAVDALGTGGKTTVKWTFQTGDTIFGSPAVDVGTGRALVGSFDSKMYAIPANPGSSAQACDSPANSAKPFTNLASWTFTIEGASPTAIESSPATDGSRVYFGASNNKVYALDVTNGNKVWEKTTGDIVVSSPAVANGVLVIGSHDDKVYWINAEDGTEIKSFQTSDSVEASPAIDGDRVFVASFDGSVWMFGPKQPLRPDLTIASLSASETGITAVIRNQGNGTAAASQVRIELDGSVVAELDVSPLDPGASHTVSHAATISPGSHTLKVTADFGKAVLESEEANNVREQSFTVQDPNAQGQNGARTQTEDGGIPGPGAVVVLAALGAAAVLARRRR